MDISSILTGIITMCVAMRDAETMIVCRITTRVMKEACDDELKARLFNALYYVLVHLLKHRARHLNLMIPSFFTIVKLLMYGLRRFDDESNLFLRQSTHTNDGLQQSVIRNFFNLLPCNLPLSSAENFARLLEEIARNHAYVFNKYTPYFLVDMIVFLRSQPLDGHVRKALLSGLYALVGICSEHELKLLNSFLDTSGKLYFKNLYTDYLASFKFKGKI